MASDAFRYARILKGFSFLISSRSPISASVLAIARLSTRRRGVDPQALALDAESEDPGAAAGERVSDRRHIAGLAQAEQAAAAARSTHFPPQRSRTARRRQEGVDSWRRHAGRETLAIVPLGRDLAADLTPVARLEGLAHRDG